MVLVDILCLVHPSFFMKVVSRFFAADYRPACHCEARPTAKPAAIASSSEADRQLATDNGCY
jgi:hypothetical protein